MPESRVGEKQSSSHGSVASGSVADAPPGNWVDDRAPAGLRPYLRLARFDRPIGAWLLLVPCWWSQGLAEIHTGARQPSLWLLFLFLVGAFVMRGAGCVHNDIVDREFDASVARTRSRPIPSGQVSVRQALAFMALLLLIGLAVLVQLNWFTIVLGASSLLLVAVYPFAKRYTYWPQIVLGLTFKWGALVGWSAVTGSLAASPIVLYAGEVEASRVPPEWHAWLHRLVVDPPDAAKIKPRPWQKPHQPNLTGTARAYRPPGHTLKGGHRAKGTGDYEPWIPS